MKNIYASIAGLVCFFTGLQTVYATDYYLKPSGVVTSTASWGDQTNGGGSSPADFTSATDTWHFDNRTSATVGNTSFNPHANALVVVENGTNLNLSLASGFSTLIDVAAGGTLSINKSNSFNLGNLDQASTVIFNNSGTTIKAATYGNVRIQQNATMVGDIFVTGLLTIDAGDILTLGGRYLFLQGTTSIAGTGTIFGDNASGIDIIGGNGGNNGTITLAPGGTVLQYFSVAYNSPSDLISLGNHLRIEGTGLFAVLSGVLDLNGFNVEVDNSSAAEFPFNSADGGIRGNTQSSLIIDGLTGQFIAGSDVLFMDQTNNNLKALVLNNPGSALTIGNQLTINDSLSVLDGNLDANGMVALVNNSTTKARVSRMGAGGSVSGNITIPTFISGGNTGWMFMGAPVAGQTVSNWDTHVSSSGANGIPMTCTGCSFPPSAFNPPFTSIQAWDEANDTYDANITSSTSLPLGKGFWVYVGDGTTTTGDLSVIGTGLVLQGLNPVTLSSSGSNTDHWNLVANPMPSPISWSKVHALTESVSPGDVGAEMHIFSPDNGYGSFVAGGSSGTNGVTDILPIGQGFYVTNPGSAANLLVDEDCKMDDQSTELFKTGRSASAINEEFFKLRISGPYGNDEAMFNFNKMATKNFDRLYDAHKIFVSAGYSGYGNSYSKYTTLSSKDASGTDYSINSMPPLTSSLSIPLLARVMSSGTHTISVSEKVNFSSCLVLYDKVLNKYHDLNTGAYVFEIADTTSTPRFELTLCQTESEPVLSVEELNSNSNILIGQDRDGAFVRTTFDKPTKATISVFNIVGQQLLKDIEVEGTETMTQLPLNVSSQVVVIRVTTDSETRVKKFIAH